MFSSTTLRLSIALAFLTVSILLVADMIGLIPNPAEAALAGRKKTCESLAVLLSAAVQTADQATIEATVKSLVDRNEDVRSAAMRTAGGKFVTEAGDHSRWWKQTTEDRSTATQVQVPIFKGSEKWGTVEVRFAPIFSGGFFGVRVSPFLQLVLFVLLSGFVAFLFFMKRTLRHLDPSSVIPERVRYALDVLAEGIVLMDADERIVLANSCFGEKVGRKPAALLGRRISELNWKLPASAAGGPVEGYPWNWAKRSGETHPATPLCLRSGTNGMQTFMVKASPILDAQEKLRGVVATFDDVTEVESKNQQLRSMVKMLERARDEVDRKNEELQRTNQIIEAKVAQRTEELSKSMEAAQAADRAKSVFLANMSHELRTPMHAVLSFAEFGIKKNVTVPRERLLGYFQEIKDSATGLMQLLNNLLDVSKSQAGKMSYNMQACRFDHIVKSVTSEFSALLQEKQLELSVAPMSAVPSVVLDPVRTAQVLRNLLLNAIKFSDTGTCIEIAVAEGTLEVHDEAVPSLEVSVLDEGVGIPEEDLEAIFEPFAQSDRTSSGAGGTGLGLAICKEIVTAHGGWIRAANRSERGSVFTFAIPRTPVESPVLA